LGPFQELVLQLFSKFFKKAKIFCIDINIKNFKYHSKNIKVYGIDVSKKVHVIKFLKKININKNKKFFDIIIDDGSHKLKDMLFGFQIFFDHLKNNGFYIIEDYKFPNYFSHLNDPSELTIDQLSKKVLSKKLFKSQILEKKFQIKIFNEIKKIYRHKGNLKISDIIFFKKK
jgi:hypothetical protein